MFCKRIVTIFYVLIACIYGASDQTKLLENVNLAESTANETSPSLKLKKFGETYYYFQTMLQGTFFQALQFCNSHNMNLVNIESAEENQFLFDQLSFYLGKGPYSIWTSGTSLVNNRHEFYWLSSGTKLQYIKWKTGEPNNMNNVEKCISVIYNTVLYKTLVWNDIDCNLAKFFICETTPSKGITMNDNCDTFSSLN